MRNIVSIFLLTLLLSLSAFAQALGTAGAVTGTVTDPKGAVVAGATVNLSNTVTGYSRTTTTDEEGSFRFNDVPQNNYNLRVSATGFQPVVHAVSVRSTVPISLPVSLSLAGASATVEVAADTTMVENVPTAHVDVDQTTISRLPLNSPGNGLSDAVTMTSPGVVADSNGFFHPQGDHAEAQYSVDGQPITDQQTKAFSTQIPVNAIQSMEVVTGAVPAEYGDKTSLVINAVTKSGLNQKRPAGSFFSTYGKFNTFREEADLAAGNERFGNFIAFNYDRSNRFLDAPEFVSIHNHGTAGSVFDRFDYARSTRDTFHINFFAARNNFQIANTYDQAALGQDQRQRVTTFDIAPGFVHIFNNSTVLSINPFYRVDNVQYFPSANPLSDQTTTIAQKRRLANYGARGDISYVHGIHNLKIGGQATWTALREQFQFGITDFGFNAVCLDANGNPAGPPTLIDPDQCAGVGLMANPDVLTGLIPFDLTRGGHQFRFNGSKTIKQQAGYIQDAMNFKNGLTLSLGFRLDHYDGIAKGTSAQPRLGISYHVARTNTVLRASYTRNYETPYNENLILSNATGPNGLGNGTLGDATVATLKPGNRNQYNVGIQQALGRHVVFDVDYFNKLTHNAYDFNVILNTPITFPIAWSKSKIHGVSGRMTLTNWKGLGVNFTAGHTVAEYFPPEVGGLFFNSDLPPGPFLIDHDQKLQTTTQVLYTFDRFKSFQKLKPFVAFTWRYDSGLVAGSVTDYATALTLSADEQQQIGLFCGSVFATLTDPITSCSDSHRGALRLRIPADGTEDDVKNPPRVVPRHLFDLSVGSDNITRSDRVRLAARLTIVNLTNREALYNFNSTFSGTHFVTPRSVQGQIGITF